jgi:hypothetical protein
MTVFRCRKPLAFLLCLGRSPGGCGKWTPENAFPFPDDRHTARLEAPYRGASGRNRSRIVLVSSDENARVDERVILEANGAIAEVTRLRWLGNDRIRIGLCMPCLLMLEQMLQIV